MFDEEYGGHRRGALMTLVAIEEVSKVCATSGLILAVQELGSLGIKLAGTDEQKRRFLPRLASASGSPPTRSPRPAPARTAAAMRTEARRDGDEYVLDGSKRFITNAGVAGLYVVFAKTDPGARPARHLGVRRRGGHARVRGRPDRAEDGDQGLDDRRALLQRLPRPGREPARRGGRGLPARDADPRPLAARDRARRASGSRRGRPTTRSSTRGRARRWASRSCSTS